MPDYVNKLTKLDIAALRHADSLVVTHAPGRHIVDLVKNNRPSEKDPFATEIRHRLDVPTSVYADGKDRSDATCFAMVSLYRFGGHAESVLKTLRVGDEISFQFYPDAHSNIAMARLRLHGDVLKLIVKRNGFSFAEFDLQTSVCPENSARMCKNVASCDWYNREVA